MSVSKIGTTGNNNDVTATSIAGSATIAVQTGDLIVVLAKHEGLSTTITTTDNAAGGSNTYTELTYDRHANDDIGIRLAWAVAKASETLTFTVNFAASRPYRGIVVWVFRSTTGTWALHEEVIAQATSGDPSAGTLTAGGTDGAAVAGFGLYYDPGAQTPGTDWTEDYDVAWLVYGESRILTNETTMTANMSDVAEGTFSWLTAAASFKVVAAGGSATLMGQALL